MTHLTRTFALLVLCAAPALATDFKPLMDVAATVWPKAHSITLIANYETSKAEIQRLADAASGKTITVLDVSSATEARQAMTLLIYRYRPDFIVALPGDRVMREASPELDLLVTRAAFAGIPTIGVTPLALHRGAVFSIGEATGMDLLVSPHPVGSIDVILPSKWTPVNQARKEGAAAGIRVVAAK